MFSFASRVLTDKHVRIPDGCFHIAVWILRHKREMRVQLLETADLSKQFFVSEGL